MHSWVLVRFRPLCDLLRKPGGSMCRCAPGLTDRFHGGNGRQPNNAFPPQRCTDAGAKKPGLRGKRAARAITGGIREVVPPPDGESAAALARLGRDVEMLL